MIYQHTTTFGLFIFTWAVLRTRRRRAGKIERTSIRVEKKCTAIRRSTRQNNHLKVESGATSNLLTIHTSNLTVEMSKLRSRFLSYFAVD